MMLWNKLPKIAGLMADQSSAQASSSASRMAAVKSAMGRLSANSLPLRYGKLANCASSAGLRRSCAVFST